MSDTQSWKTWVTVIVVLVAFGVFAAVWPSISSTLSLGGLGGRPSTRIPYESHPIVLQIPEMPLPNGATLGGQTFEMQPWQALLGLTAVIVGLVLGMGVVTGLLYAFLSRLSTRERKAFNAEHSRLSPLYKGLNRGVIFFQNQAARKFEGRTVHPIPAHEMPRWSWLSTTLIVLTFVFFGGMVIVADFFPARLLAVGNDLFNPATLIVGIPLLITLTLFLFAPRWGTAVFALLILFALALPAFGAVNLFTRNNPLPLPTAVSIVGLVQLVALVLLAYFWRPSPTAVFKVSAAPEKGIPYDAIAVLITGIFVVGLGLGLMVLFNSPVWEEIQQLLGL